MQVRLQGVSVLSVAPHSRLNIMFGLQRVEGQPALPMRDLEAETAQNDQDDQDDEEDVEADEDAEMTDEDADANGEDA